MQSLVWCVSDITDALADYLVDTCEDSLPETKRAEILASVPAAEDPMLELTPATQQVEAGDTAVVTLTSNINGFPIDLNLDAGVTALLCEPVEDVLLADGAIKYSGVESFEADLCISTVDEGELGIQASADLPDSQFLEWNQSQPILVDVDCQVYSTWESHRAEPFTSAGVTVTFGGDNDGLDDADGVDGADGVDADGVDGDGADADGLDADDVDGDGADADGLDGAADADDSGNDADEIDDTDTTDVTDSFDASELDSDETDGGDTAATDSVGADSDAIPGQQDSDAGSGTDAASNADSSSDSLAQTGSADALWVGAAGGLVIVLGIIALLLPRRSHRPETSAH